MSRPFQVIGPQYILLINRSQNIPHQRKINLFFQVLSLHRKYRIQLHYQTHRLIFVMFIKCLYSLAKHLSFLIGHSLQYQCPVVIKKEKLTRTTPTPFAAHTVIDNLLIVLSRCQLFTNTVHPVEFHKLIQDRRSIGSELQPQTRQLI